MVLNPNFFGLSIAFVAFAGLDLERGADVEADRFTGVLERDLEEGIVLLPINSRPLGLWFDFRQFCYGVALL